MSSSGIDQDEQHGSRNRGKRTRRHQQRQRVLAARLDDVNQPETGDVRRPGQRGQRLERAPGIAVLVRVDARIDPREQRIEHDQAGVRLTGDTGQAGVSFGNVSTSSVPSGASTSIR